MVENDKEATHESPTVINGEANLNLYSGGDREVGDPAYHQNGVVAYSLSQAKTIFENLLEAKLQGKTIPFIDAEGPEGENGPQGMCAVRRDVMMKHMLWHQHVAQEAIGVGITYFTSKANRKLVDYVSTINQRLDGNNQTSVADIRGDFAFHTAPTINVLVDDEVVPMVLDPTTCRNPATYKQWQNSQLQHVDVYHYHWGSSQKLEAVGTYKQPLSKWEIRQCYKRIDKMEVPRELNDRVHKAAEVENATLEEGREKQGKLAVRAAEIGIDHLSNCGPRALQEVSAVLRKQSACR